jgi:hypothetical protein
MSLPGLESLKFDYFNRRKRNGRGSADHQKVNFTLCRPFDGFNAKGEFDPNKSRYSSWSFLSKLNPQLATSAVLAPFIATEQIRWQSVSIPGSDLSPHSLTLSLRDHLVALRAGGQAGVPVHSLLPSQDANPNQFAWRGPCEVKAALYTAAVWPPLGQPFEVILNQCPASNSAAIAADRQNTPHHVFILSRKDLAHLGGCSSSCVDGCQRLTPADNVPCAVGDTRLSQCSVRYADDDLISGLRPAAAPDIRPDSNLFPWRFDSPPLDVIFTVITTVLVDNAAICRSVGTDSISTLIGNHGPYAVCYLTWDGFARQWSQTLKSSALEFTDSRHLRRLPPHDLDSSILEPLVDYWDLRCCQPIDTRCLPGTYERIDPTSLTRRGVVRDSKVENAFRLDTQFHGQHHWWPLVA